MLVLFQWDGCEDRGGETSGGRTQIEHARSGGFGDVLAVGDFEEGVQLGKISLAHATDLCGLDGSLLGWEDSSGGCGTW